MGMFHHYGRGGKRLQRKTISEHHAGVRFAALLLCLSMLAGFLPALARAADGGPLLSSMVTFDSITLHYADAYGKPVEPAIQTGQDTKTLLEKDQKLVLKYTYHITEEQCENIAAGTCYYLDVSPHLVLPANLSTPLNLKLKDETTEQQFGTLYADGTRAWVTFLADSTDNSKTVLSEFAPLYDAYFYLDCNRADDVPADATEEEKKNNLYAMKFETTPETSLHFGYAENEPVTAKAQINKGGSLTGKTITWTIDYTPWQNPAEGDGVTLDTPFELRDTINNSLHSFVNGSVTIDDDPVTNTYTFRGDIPEKVEAYVLVEDSGDGASTLLTFGGTKFNAGEATGADPAKPVAITYKTEIKDELLLPGGTGGKSVTNAADLFADKDGAFNRLNISSSSTIPIPQPIWLEKEGKTTRIDGQGSTTDWEVVFYPNGFAFTEENHLVLHDQLPGSSEPVKGSLEVNGKPVTVNVGEDKSFTVSPILPEGTEPVHITYQTHVPEEWYIEHDDLGSNVAYFTFEYDGASYTTPEAVKQIGSGDGSGTSGTPKLTKAGGKYNPEARTVEWTVNINPHRAYFMGGTFTDDLGAVIPACGDSGHGHGLELVNVVADIDVKISDGANSNVSREPTEDEKELISLEYAQ